MRREILADGVELILGDCRDVLPTLGRVDAVITDPPYGIDLQPQRGITDAIQGDGKDEAQNLWQEFVPACFELAESNTSHLFWTGWSEVWTKAELEKYFRVKSCVVWGKNVWGIGYYTRPQHEMAWYCHKGKPPVLQSPDSDLWLVPKVHKPEHSCEKPVELLERAVRLCAPNAGERVLDPFMGVGGAGVAAVKLGRKFIGIEIEPKYFDIACRRIEDALRRPDLFIEQPKPKPVQESLI